MGCCFVNIEVQQHQFFVDFLRVEVPREMQAIIDRGGVNDLDWEWLRQEINGDRSDLRPLNVLARADEFLLYPSNADIATQAFLVLRKSISIMAFVPGGVRVFGLHFSSNLPKFVEVDQW